jgi:uncharacterized protein YndB with AHSA1/START domain
MPEKKFDWTFFKRRIYINNCRSEDIFRKWATPHGLTEWFIAQAEYRAEDGISRKPDETVKANDRYKWTFHRGSVVNGTVLEVKKDELFRFTFGKNDIDSDEDVIVTVTIGKKNGRCFFDILQDNMAVSNYGRVYYYISCNMGWMFHMNNLKSLYEAGHDLRITGENRMHVDAPSGYPLAQYKWTEFTQKEYIKASRKAVFEYWVIPKNIVRWFITEADYKNDQGVVRNPGERIQPGDCYMWQFFQGIELNGKILEVIDEEYLSFTFGKKEPGSDENVVVDIRFFTDTVDRTRIELHQKNMADSEYGRVNYNMSCMIGWCYYLTNLRSLFESGYDLRERDPEIARQTRAYTL